MAAPVIQAAPAAGAPPVPASAAVGPQSNKVQDKHQLSEYSPQPPEQLMAPLPESSKESQDYVEPKEPQTPRKSSGKNPRSIPRLQTSGSTRMIISENPTLKRTPREEPTKEALNFVDFLDTRRREG